MEPFDYHGALVVVGTDDGLPAIIPVRVANQRVLAAYLRQREEGKEPHSGSGGSMPSRSSANAEQNFGPDPHNY